VNGANDRFVRASLRLDERLHDRIHETAKARGGALMPMEYGMLEVSFSRRSSDSAPTAARRPQLRGD